MGDEDLPLFQPDFNGCLKAECRPERLSGEAGGVICREAIERLGIVDWLTERLIDPRDQDDAGSLRDDPVMRLSVSTRRGVAPFQSPAEDSPADKKAPDGLASQPTLSRPNSAGVADSIRPPKGTPLPSTAIIHIYFSTSRVVENRPTGNNLIPPALYLRTIFTSIKASPPSDFILTAPL